MTSPNDSNEVIAPKGKDDERWPYRPTKAEQRLMRRALRERRGVARSVIMRECLIMGLRKYAGKKDLSTISE